MARRSAASLVRTSLAAALVLAAPAALAPAALLIPSQALAFDEASTLPINVDAAGVMVHGHDVVAYFTEAKPVKGSSQFSAKHEGGTYHFSSARNRDAFVADPSRYAPQYGGFCAMGVSFGKKFDGDPNQFHVTGGKLYLNVNEAVQKRWLEDVPANVKRASDTWPSIRTKTPKEIN